MGRDNSKKSSSSGRGNRWNNKKKKGGRDQKKTATSKKKTLADHIYYVGSAKQASDYVTVTNYIINHIRRTFEKGNDIATALEDQKEFDLTQFEPQLRFSTKDAIKEKEAKEREDKQFEKQFEIEFQTYNDRKVKYQENRSAAAATLWNQCASSMRSKLQSRTDYDKIKGDPVELLKAIKQHALSYESNQYQMKTICEATKTFINTRQREDEDSVEHLEQFKAALQVFLSHVGKDFCFPKIVKGDDKYADYKKVLEDTTAKEEDKAKAQTAIDELKKTCMDEFYGYLYLANADRLRYASILRGVDAHYLQRKDQEPHKYPEDLISAQHMLRGHKYDPEYKAKKLKRREHSEDNKQSKEKEDVQFTFAQLKNACCSTLDYR